MQTHSLHASGLASMHHIMHGSRISIQAALGIRSIDLDRHGPSKQLWHVLVCCCCHVDTPLPLLALLGG